MLTPALCRDRSAECRRLAAAAKNRGVQDILLDMARTWTRLAVEAEQWVQENSPKRRLAKKDSPARPLFPQIFLRLPLHGASL